MLMMTEVEHTIRKNSGGQSLPWDVPPEGCGDLKKLNR